MKTAGGIMKRFLIPIILSFILGFVGCGGDDDSGTDGGNGQVTPPPRLVVDTTAAAPPMTDVNTGWTNVDSVLVEIGGDPDNYGYNTNLQKQNVIVKAIKKLDTLYIRVKWHDPAGADTMANRFRKTAQENVWEYGNLVGQDMFFILFDVQDNGDEGADCATMCHATIMMTTGGGHADAWKWMSTATRPGKMADDMWFSSTGTAEDMALTKRVHRSNNFFNLPKYMHEDTIVEISVLYIEDTLPFLNDYFLPSPWPEGWIIPGYYIDSAIYVSSDRNDESLNNVRAISEFDEVNEDWTVVFSRALNTGKSDDVNLAVLDSIQVTMAATNKHQESDIIPKPEHSGSKPFWIILNLEYQ
jgi:hypothetical protein